MTALLPIQIPRLFPWLLVPSLALAAQFAGAAEPPQKAFVGVTAGVTTEGQLRQNEQWGGPVEQTLQEDGSKLLEFRFGIWKKVVTLVESGVVRVVDVTPPDRARAEQLSKVLQLGELVPVASRQSLPAGALVGPPVSVEWQPFRSSGAANVLVFAQQTDGKWYARLMRFYSPGRAPAQVRDAQQDILDFDKELQDKPVSVRNDYVRRYYDRALAHQKNGDLEQAAIDFWNGRQLAVIKSIPTLAWVVLQVEVTDEASEAAQFGDLINRFDRDSRERCFAGVRIRRVLPGGRAARAGLRSGTRILKIDDKDVARARDVEQALQGKSRKQSVRLLVRSLSGEDRLVVVVVKN